MHKTTTRELVQVVLNGSVQRLIANESAVQSTDETDETDAVHDARVATRRLRSDLRTFRPVLDESWSEPLRDELRWVGRLLGNVRDADVLRELLETRADELPPGEHAVALRLVARLRAERAEDREALLEALRSDRYSALVGALTAAVSDPHVQDGPGTRSARKVAPGLVRQPWRRLRKAVRSLPGTPTDQELHTVRKRAKSVRYAAEAAAPVIGKPARRFAKRMEDIQEILGTHQDLVVADMWLVDVLRDIDASDEAFVAGKLDGLLNLERERIRSEWPDTWRAAERHHDHGWF